MADEVGFEPTTQRLTAVCSTTELLIQLKYIGVTYQTRTDIQLNHNQLL